MLFFRIDCSVAFVFGLLCNLFVVCGCFFFLVKALSVVLCIGAVLHVVISVAVSTDSIYCRVFVFMVWVHLLLIQLYVVCLLLVCLFWGECATPFCVLY